MLLSDGVPIAVVSKRLGHSKASTTLDFYARVLPETKATLGDRLEQRLTTYETPLGKHDASGGISKQKPRLNSVLTGFPNVPRARIELATPGFSDLCSTD